MNISHRRVASLLTGISWLLLFALQPAHATEATAARLSGAVTWVYDADTLEIAPLGKVRLLGIDAPEKNPSSRDDKFLSMGTARQQLRAIHREGLAWCIRHIKGQQVTLSFDQPRCDRYGRLLAYVHLADGRLLNRVLLEEGLVIVYRRFPFRLKNEFLAAERAAKDRLVGLWRTPPQGNPKERKE